jgi:hypothetical protein
MHATSLTALVRPAPRAAVVPRRADRLSVAAAEEQRWLKVLIIPFLIGASFFAAAIGTGHLWLIGPAMFFSVAMVIFGFIYLALTSESNGVE